MGTPICVDQLNIEDYIDKTFKQFDPIPIFLPLPREKHLLSKQLI
jgi:hypothetical protein